jgi:hypothetical protein
MKQSINLHQFRNAFKDMNRENQFSYEGLEVLFNHLEQYESDTGESVEFDVIGLCCEFVEMTEQEIKDSYASASEYDDVEDFISENTWYCGRTEQNTLVFQQF